MTSKNRLTVNLSDDEAYALSQIAKKSKVSKSWLGRRAICALLERAKEDDVQLPLSLTAVGGGRR